jgi:hypothetical protein
MDTHVVAGASAYGEHGVYAELEDRILARDSAVDG